VFIPKNQALVGAPPGKVRAVGYALCARCHSRPDWQQRLDDQLMNDLKAAAAAGGN
jgi:hypothetical protein